MRYLRLNFRLMTQNCFNLTIFYINSAVEVINITQNVGLIHYRESLLLGLQVPRDVSVEGNRHGEQWHCGGTLKLPWESRLVVLLPQVNMDMSVRERSLDDLREEDGSFPGREKNSGSRGVCGCKTRPRRGPGSSSEARLRRRRAGTNFPHKRASRPRDAPPIHSPSTQCRSPSHRKALPESHIRARERKGGSPGTPGKKRHPRPEEWAEVRNAQHPELCTLPSPRCTGLFSFAGSLALAYTRAFVHLLITGAYAPFSRLNPPDRSEIPRRLSTYLSRWRASI